MAKITLLTVAAVVVLTAAACRPPVTLPVAAAVPGNCTPAPTAPPGAPSDWSATVHPNCFDDLERLGRWVGGTLPLRPGMSPESNYRPVSPGSIGGSNTEVVVLVHGWAPGFRTAVDRAGGKLRWWSNSATNSDNVYSSDWAWVQTAVSTPAVSECVSATGFFQQLRAHRSDAVVLGFSWLDHSATGGSYSDLIEVYRSEAYTNIAGIRLANALEKALSDEFWQGTGNRLHLIGHSHGSKVATVAALTLQERGKRIDHLTILDSPESEITLQGNGANLLGFYLDQMSIADPGTGLGGAFVDNHVSVFGVNYKGLKSVIGVNLGPSALYSYLDVGDQHSYAAAWYAGAAAAVRFFGLSTPLGLDWPPLPETFRQFVQFGLALNQIFDAPSGVSDPCANLTSLDPGQWRLSPGPPQRRTFGYSTAATRIEVDDTQNVTCTPGCDDPKSLTLRPDSGGTAAIFRGGYSNRFTSGGYGLAFDVTWTNATAGDYLVATVDSPVEGEIRTQEVILVMDGRSRPAGTHPVAFNADSSSGIFEDVGFAFYLVPGAGSGVEVTIANFRRVLVSGVKL